MWVEFVVGSLLCSERFFSGYSGFPLSPKTNTSKFQFDRESGRRRTSSWMCYLQIIIYYLYIYLFIKRTTQKFTLFVPKQQNGSKYGQKVVSLPVDNCKTNLFVFFSLSLQSVHKLFHDKLHFVQKFLISCIHIHQ